MRALFFGTPEIAVPALRALAEIAEIKGVVCQPDRPSGRGMRLTAPPVKIAAQELGIAVLQPTRVRDGTLAKCVRDADVDVALVIAYGRILGGDVLRAPRLGCVNLHASLLPRYRGAAPIQRALMAGESLTGVCLMQMDEGMDTGPVLAVRELPISPEDDHGSLAERIALLAAELTREALPQLERGELVPVPQDESLATYASPITRKDTLLDPTLPASQLQRQIRGLSPRPGAFGELLHPGSAAAEKAQDEKARSQKVMRLKLLRAEVSEESGPAGVFFERQGDLLLGCGEGSLRVLWAQMEGKRAQSGRDLLNGRSVCVDDRLIRPHAAEG